MLVINDLHVGVVRQGGTTPQSQQALRDYVRSNLARILETTKEHHVVVNGDLFDGFTVDVSEVIKTYESFADWMHGMENYNTLTLIMGNHDASARGDKVSSFHLLAHFLKARFPTSVTVIDHTTGFCQVDSRVWAISHCMNQELFNLEIARAVEVTATGMYLLLHANYKNGFAENSDHSLNLNDEQVGNLMRAGWTVVLGHEHQGYEMRGGRVIVVGNQFPTSISDCIGEKSKRALIIDEDGHRFVETWRADGSYIEVDWQEVYDGNASFIRVVGEAAAAESASVVKACASLRQRSDAFVVTLSVKIDGVEGLSEMTTQIEGAVKEFDILQEILNHLNPQETACVMELLNENKP